VYDDWFISVTELLEVLRKLGLPKARSHATMGKRSATSNATSMDASTSASSQCHEKRYPFLCKNDVKSAMEGP
jgi:hypothetical protein